VAGALPFFILSDAKHVNLNAREEKSNPVLKKYGKARSKINTRRRSATTPRRVDNSRIHMTRMSRIKFFGFYCKKIKQKNKLR